MKVAENTVVQIHYTLTDDAGELIDSSKDREPLAYLHGASNIVPGLEDALEGVSQGESLEVHVDPDQGYGNPDPALQGKVPLAQLEEAGPIEVGTRLRAESPDGTRIFTVTKIDDDIALIDGNHPLAGQTLHFAVEVVSVRDASEQEIVHGHAHGTGGHQH